MDEIKNYIQQHRTQFDVQKPDDQVWPNIIRSRNEWLIRNKARRKWLCFIITGLVIISAGTVYLANSGIKKNKQFKEEEYVVDTLPSLTSGSTLSIPDTPKQSVNKQIRDTTIKGNRKITRRAYTPPVVPAKPLADTFAIDHSAPSRAPVQPTIPVTPTERKKTNTEKPKN